ncbi:hypothetical protein OFO99_40730, partial [Escherichia coli]|nr:hypothetical protein [Escherichia coli]
LSEHYLLLLRILNRHVSLVRLVKIKHYGRSLQNYDLHAVLPFNKRFLPFTELTLKRLRTKTFMN